MNGIDLLEKISQQRERWIIAINEGDADRFAAVVAEDAVWLPAGGPAIRGRERIREWLAAPFAAFIYDYSVTNIEVRPAGEWAVEQARFRTQVESQEGGEVRVHEGRYTIIWRYGESAGWLIERYIDRTGFELDSD